MSIGNLDDDDAVQLTLPFDHRDPVDGVVDEVKDKYGSAAITRAVLLGRDEGITMPQLPD